MQAQRARDAVNSNERERTPSFRSIRTDKNSFHEPNVGMECVWSGIACIQVSSRPKNRHKIRLTDEPFKVKNQRRIVSGIRVHALDWARKKEVKSWSANVRDRYWKIAQSRRAARTRVLICL